MGLLLGVFASRLLEHIVYQANPRDPVVVGGAVLMMALFGIAAAAIPALRALDVDPSNSCGKSEAAECGFALVDSDKSRQFIRASWRWRA